MKMLGRVREKLYFKMLLVYLSFNICETNLHACSNLLMKKFMVNEYRNIVNVHMLNTCMNKQVIPSANGYF